MRQLASVKKIREIKTALNSDFLELAIIEGWQCVVKKGEYKPGDLCVYIEIDSLIPVDNPHFQFLVEKNKKRIRTEKFRGNISQGLVMPLSILPDYKSKNYKDDDDVTDILNIKKYERPISNSRGGSSYDHQFKGDFPKHLVDITDEPRIQSNLWLLDEIKGLPYYISTKMDGSSATYLIMGDDFEVCSRNKIIRRYPMKKEKIPKSFLGKLWWKITFHKQKIYEDKNATLSPFFKVSDKYEIEKILRDKAPGYIIQGELCGPGIQSNRLELSDYDLYVFNIYDAMENKYLSYNELVDFCHLNNLNLVPILEEGDSFNYTYEEVLAMSKGHYENTKNLREGIVIRPKEDVQLIGKKVKRLSFKSVDVDYLLKQTEENSDDE